MPSAAPRKPPRQSWPPPPSVEDEEASLSREHSPALPELEKSEAKERGSIDQLPIMMEVGKGATGKEKKAPKTDQKSRGVRFEDQSSDDSSGPETPTETSSDPDSSKNSSHGDLRKVKKYDRDPPTPSSPSIQDVLRNKLRPTKSASRVDTLKVEHAHEDAEKVRSARQPSPYTYSPTSRKGAPAGDYFTAKEALHPDQYPGTLNELKSPHHEHQQQQHLPFAERHRTMSGSDNTADHRPHNVRHMSAMGYAGESKTPSFPRDHPMHITPEPRGVPPQFRKPQPHKTSAIESDTASDEDLSPDEKPRKAEKQRVRDMHRTVSHESHSRSGDHDYPVRHGRDPPTRSQRPSTPPEKRPELPVRPHPSQHGHQHASHPPPLPRRQESKQGSLSSHPSSPTGSPEISSRPSSRDGSLKVVYPTIKKRQHTSRPPSPVASSASHQHDFEYFDGHHAPSNLRNSSNPSSPTLQTSAQPADRHYLQDPSRQSNLPRSRKTSPHPTPLSGRSPKPDLRVDVQAPTPEPGPKTWAGNRPELPPRPVSGGGPAHSHATSPILPMTAPLWATDHHSRRSHEEHEPSSARPAPKPRPAATHVQLVTCPRGPGFVTGFHDWWTLPQVPELDICPTCKDSLEDNGVASQFVRCKERPPGYKTRCDMTVPWVRMAWLMVLQGRANSSLIRELMSSIGHEEPCPERENGVRRWHRIYDPESGKNVSKFDICPCCVRAIETIFPNLRGAFQLAHPSGINHPPKPRMCDLTCSQPRFARYVDLLEEISDSAAHWRREPNMIRFIQLAKTFSDVRPCRRDDQFRSVPWHYMPHLPDFTICEECYVDVVWPAALGGCGLAKQVSSSLQMSPHRTDAKMSCQLYSVRMRRVFEEACKREDFAGLRNQVMARVNKERELQGRVDMVQDLPSDWQEREMERLVAEWKRWE